MMVRTMTIEDALINADAALIKARQVFDTKKEKLTRQEVDSIDLLVAFVSKTLQLHRMLSVTRNDS